MSTELSLAIIAGCFLFFTIVFVIALLFLIKFLRSANTLVQKIQANVEKAGTVIDDVKAAVESVKAAVDTFRNPFTTLITFLSSVIPVFINKFKNNKKKKGFFQRKK